MAKKFPHNQKILLMTDTASDISDADITQYGIVMLPIPIAIDGKGYLERVDFTTAEFYQRLAAAKELPATSHILSVTYVQAYEDAFENGYTHIINTTITSKGSNMFQAAVLAKKMFYEEHPEAKDKIHIQLLDSGSYSLGYGYAVVEGAKMAGDGKNAQEIYAWMDHYFSCAEIYFATYSLEYAKKSGRIPAATAFVGDVLGLRPIISIIDGKTTTVEKVRGDKNVVPRIVENALSRVTDKRLPTAMVYGEVQSYADDLQKAISKAFGHAPKMNFQAGASISINSGPKVVGLVVQGAERINTRAREQDFDNPQQ